MAETAQPLAKCVHHMFELQARRSPQRTALVSTARSITYRELNDRANQIAHFLQRLGVGADVRVAICMQKSIELIAGTLGVLKAGGAYVPIDPDYPQDRVRYMLEDAGAAVLLVEKGILGTLPPIAAPTVVLALEEELIGAQSKDNPQSEATHESLMYVIYTSGSSGRPKGTLVTHGNASRLFAAAREYFDFNESDVWTLFHSVAFDFSVWEMWGALLYGGQLIIVPKQIGVQPQAFHDLVNARGVTVLNQTPSAFKQFMHIEATSKGKSSTLRYVIFGGEALDAATLKNWFKGHDENGPQLINMYGITETTVHVTFKKVTVQDVVGNTSRSIGRPLCDMQAWIVTESSSVAAAGEMGELYIGGAGVARGYHNRPALTAERFLPDPFASGEGQRLYRTGDLARYLANGEIEYVGRADQQVKIRGFRIELGEVEAVLGQHPGVSSAVVTPREDVPGEKRLVAYVTVPDPTGPSVSDLRKFLKDSVPEYMVPAAFVVLEKMPLTPHGKIDKRALPVPGRGRPDLEEPYVAPRNLMEEALVRIWCEALGVDEIGVNDNFFDLGGHSLLGIELIARVRDDFQAPIPLQALFDAPTVSRLAAEVLRWQAEQCDAANVAEVLAELEAVSEGEDSAPPGSAARA